jgi:hypothetical protein
MAIKIPISSIARPSKIYPNWSEKIPSDNTVIECLLPAAAGRLVRFTKVQKYFWFECAQTVFQDRKIAYT